MSVTRLRTAMVSKRGLFRLLGASKSQASAAVCAPSLNFSTAPLILTNNFSKPHNHTRRSIFTSTKLSSLSSRVSLRPVKLNYSVVDGGTEPPLVFVHGLYGSSSNFRTIGKATSKLLSQDRKVYSLDLRNHGNSEHADSMDMRAIAGDIVRFLDEQDIEKAVICGHSLGGRAAMATALLHPSRVERLMVVDISPVSTSLSSANEIGKIMATLPLDSISSRKAADAFLAPLIKESAIRSFVMQNLVVEKGKTPYWRINLPVLNGSMAYLGRFDLAVEPNIGSYNGPTFFLYGSKSDYVNERVHGRAIKKLFPKTTFDSLPTGHWVHAEEPKRFVNMVRDFIESSSA